MAIALVLFFGLELSDDIVYKHSMALEFRVQDIETIIKITKYKQLKDTQKKLKKITI